jgi:hypothetical protein
MKNTSLFNLLDVKERHEGSLMREKGETGGRIWVWGDYFWGGLWAKFTPFVMLPFKPSTQALRRVFSFSSRFVRGFRAFSAPDVWF